MADPPLTEGEGTNWPVHNRQSVISKIKKGGGGGVAKFRKVLKTRRCRSSPWSRSDAQLNKLLPLQQMPQLANLCPAFKFDAAASSAAVGRPPIM
jgi:hypothetical protein